MTNSNTKTDDQDVLGQIKDILSSTYEVSIDLGDPQASDELRWLKRDGRDFTAVTPEVVAAGQAAFVNVFKTNQDFSPESVTDAMEAMGQAIKKHMAKRWQGATDVQMRPLTPAYVKRKGNSVIGFLTGRLLRAFTKAKVTVRPLKK